MAGNAPTSAVDQARVGALMNGRYHADREAFLDGCHRWAMFAIIILGASAFSDLMPDWAKHTAALTSAVLAAIDLVFDLSVRARNHAALREGYFQVAADLESSAKTASLAQADMMLLAAKEEPPYFAAHAIAENWATCAVLGPDVSAPCHVGGFKRVTRHLFRWAGTDFSIK